jgi:ribosomal protein S18 acetylase RimI-like enzyme
MAPPAQPRIVVREAREADVEAMRQVEYTQHPAVHRDRIGVAARSWNLDYLLAELDGRVAGFGVLVMGLVPGWPVLNPVPQIVDLYVADDLRSRGVGTALVMEMAQRVRRRKRRYLYLGVEPENNPTAYRFYRNLGFEPMQETPRHEEWSYTDSDGHEHSGQIEVIDMRLDLAE